MFLEWGINSRYKNIGRQSDGSPICLLTSLNCLPIVILVLLDYNLINLTITKNSAFSYLLYSAFQLSKPQNCCRSQESGVRRQEAGGRRQEAGGRRQRLVSKLYILKLQPNTSLRLCTPVQIDCGLSI